MDPFKQKGPIPFELEFGVSWYVPYLTYHSYGYSIFMDKNQFLLSSMVKNYILLLIRLLK